MAPAEGELGVLRERIAAERERSELERARLGRAAAGMAGLREALAEAQRSFGRRWLG